MKVTITATYTFEADTDDADPESVLQGQINDLAVMRTPFGAELEGILDWSVP